MHQSPSRWPNYPSARAAATAWRIKPSRSALSLTRMSHKPYYLVGTNAPRYCRESLRVIQRSSSRVAGCWSSTHVRYHAFQDPRSSSSRGGILQIISRESCHIHDPSPVSPPNHTRHSLRNFQGFLTTGRPADMRAAKCVPSAQSLRPKAKERTTANLMIARKENQTRRRWANNHRANESGRHKAMIGRHSA
jgi:hypothetical protein